MIRKLLALLLLIIFIPIFIIISIIIIIDDGWPIFFLQEKYGENHKKFFLYKFRTMLKNTPEIATEEFDEKHQKKYLLKSGNFLRKYSLDELVQLLNIIKGEMNFIGPRPCMVNNEEKLKDLREKNGVYKEVPGITGWAQINGRDLNSFEEKADLDYYYLNNQNFLLDLKILLKTFIVVFFTRNIKH